jgi:hypothetical protein
MAVLGNSYGLLGEIPYKRDGLLREIPYKMDGLSGEIPYKRDGLLRERCLIKGMAF